MGNHKGHKRERPWFKDPNVVELKWGVALPPNHVRRCQAGNSLGSQCGNYAVTGSDYCIFHGGRHAKSRKRMAEYYSKHCGPKLQDVLKELAKDSDDDRLNLGSEVDAIRTVAQRAIKVYSKVVIEDELQDTKKTPAQIVAAKSAATTILQQALDAVHRAVGQMAKVEALKRDKIGVNNIDWIVKRLMIILTEELKGCPEEEKRIQKRIMDMKLADVKSTNVVISV